MPIILGAMALIAVLAALATAVAWIFTSETGETIRAIASGPVGWGLAIGVAIALFLYGREKIRRKSQQ